MLQQSALTHAIKSTQIMIQYAFTYSHLDVNYNVEHVC